MKLSKLVMPSKHRTVEDFNHAIGKARGWFRGQGHIIMANHELGVFIHYIMWRNQEGNLTHDRPVLITRGGAIILPVDSKGRAGLILKRQPQPSHPYDWYTTFPDYHVNTLGEWSFEAVGEMGEQGEEPIDTAKRGIGEETGLVATKFTKVGTFCSDPPSIVNYDYYFIAEVKKNPNASPTDSTEGIVGKIHFFTRQQVINLRQQGRIYDTRTLALLGIHFGFI